MNRLEIISMEAGIELDGHVAENIMGIRTQIRSGLIVDENEAPLPAYSEVIEYAWEVVNEMLEGGLSLELIIGADGNTLAYFFDAQTIPDDRSNQIVCESVPEAICKAALLTKFSLV